MSQYPDQVKRIVRQYVLAAKWVADNEQTPADAYGLWTKSGVPFSSFKERKTTAASRCATR